MVTAPLRCDVVYTSSAWPMKADFATPRPPAIITAAAVEEVASVSFDSVTASETARVPAINAFFATARPPAVLMAAAESVAEEASVTLVDLRMPATSTSSLKVALWVTVNWLSMVTSPLRCDVVYTSSAWPIKTFLPMPTPPATINAPVEVEVESSVELSAAPAIARAPR